MLESVCQYGLHSRIRCDQGRGNILVTRHMLEHCGEERRSVLVGSSIHNHEERRSVLVGSSIHNQRIERLWRDSHRCVTSIFYRLFYYMEYNDHLDSNNEVHLFSIHFIFFYQ